MGVPVALEMALLFPEAIGSLVLMNGFHGQAFQTAFQPLVRIPFMGDATALLVETLVQPISKHMYRAFLKWRKNLDLSVCVFAIFIGCSTYGAGHPNQKHVPNPVSVIKQFTPPFDL